MRSLFILSFVFMTAVSAAQDSLISGKYLDQINQKTVHFTGQLDRRSEEALNRVLKYEKKLQFKLAKIDSAAADNIFTHSIDSLTALKSKLKSKIPDIGNKANFGYLDSLQNSIGFLKESKELLSKAKGVQDKLTASSQSLKNLQSKLQQAAQIKNYIRERRQQLKAQLSQYTGLTKDLQKLNKEAYYYAQQLKEYKDVFSEPKKAEAKAMELLKKLPQYQDFLKRNSHWASLFGLAANNGTPNLEGLQTRAQVEQLIQQRIGGGGPNADAIRGQMAEARAQLAELKEKFPDLDNAAEMPEFKPKEMKTKSFLQRLEFGSNVQFQRSSQYFPTTGDIAGQVAYKFSKNGSVGFGAAYKLGLGTGFDNIAISHQGMGFRSFGDYKLKGTFFANGGFEYDFRPAAGWNRSALVGISKKYKINNKLKGNMILLYDFLAHRQIPRTDPVKFRLGYSF